MSSRKRLKRTTNDDSIVASKPLDQAQSSSKASEQSPITGNELGVRVDVKSSDRTDLEGSHEYAPQTPPSNKAWNVGTWPRISKSNPSTKVATDSILATVGKQAKSKQSRLLSEYSQSPDSSSNSKASSLKNEPSLAIIQASESSNVSENVNPIKDSKSTSNNPEILSSANLQSEDKKGEQNLLPQDKQASEPSTWLGWFSSPKPENTVAPGIDSKPAAVDVAGKMDVAEDGKVKPEQAPEEDVSNGTKGLVHTSQQPKAWLGFWGSSNATPRANTPATGIQTGDDILGTQSPPPSMVENNQINLNLDEAPSDSQDTVSPTGVRTSGWAFWSRDAASSTESTSAKKEGNDVAKPPTQTESTTPIKSAPGKRTRPLSLDINDGKPNGPQDSPAQNPIQLKDGNLTLAVTDMRKAPPNLVLPTLKNTYHLVDNASILEQLARLLHLGKSYPIKHVSLSREPVRIKKALAIGVHGYFPAPLLRTVLGQPTGTSIRFASSAAEAIERFTAGQGYTCEIEKVALEGEGRISERIETLWRLMLNWIDHIKNADFIMVACHSQGVPVAMMLIAKLIEFGCVTSARIGVCAMAGVNLGPFPDYKSRLFSSGTAGELFEFSNPKSLVSQRYEDALRVALHHGVRIVYIGSIDDQLVSLESSTFSTLSHPYVYRAVFIDGRVHAPDFITHLVGFALKLRNLGISDHGLVRELSSPLAGSLYTGEGHSRVYNENSVYDLAVEYALMTTSVGDVPLQVMERQTSTNVNPYILPWSMRGLLEEEYVKTELGKETQKLLEQFDEWKPTSKVLKDVKFRLEAVKSKL